MISAPGSNKIQLWEAGASENWERTGRTEMLFSFEEEPPGICLSSPLLTEDLGVPRSPTSKGAF